MMEPGVAYSCQEITKVFIESEQLTGNKAHYLSGSISSILAKLVEEGTLEYAPGRTKKGGHLYQLKQPVKSTTCCSGNIYNYTKCCH